VASFHLSAKFRKLCEESLIAQEASLKSRRRPRLAKRTKDFYDDDFFGKNQADYA
jgi:hypothetical protein